jgi:hypothetical protein
MAVLSAACSKEDTGQCCKVLPGREPTLIPQPESGDDGPRNVIRIDPAFDCENLTCVSYQATPAYCTKECAFDDGCPEGFACEPVIVSDPGPDSNIRPGTKFCVRVQSECLMD